MLRRSSVLLAVVTSWACLPSVSEAGWITLTSGKSGAAEPAGTTGFWYGTPAALPLVAVDALSGVGTVQVVTGGGTAFVSGLGVPVLLNLSDGSASLAGGSPPPGAPVLGPDGAAAGAPASAAPQAGVPVPADYARLGVALAPNDTGSWVLTASVIGSEGGSLGSGSVVVPESGWWVLGLGPDQQSAPDPLPDPIPDPLPDPLPDPSAPTRPTTPPAPGVPEPTTAALAAVGACFAFLRRNRSRAAAG